jgi:hypothetical protein
MRRVPFSLALVVLFTVSAAVGARALSPPKCTDFREGRPVRVCTQLDESALSGPGRSTKWRVWVEGDGTPIQVRLHNSSPAVVRLKGGEDQIVHMGCRRHHEVRRKVVAVGTGEAKLDARPYSESPRQEAATIAAALAPRLAQIEAEFLERRSRLAPDFPATAVSELLDTTEGEVLTVLSYQELAALRDYVQEQFRQARAEREKPDAKQRTGDLPFHPRAVLASLVLPMLPAEGFPAEPPREATTSKTVTESVLDRIGRMLHHLTGMAEQNDLVTSLCVMSEPGTHAKFLMRPRAVKEWTIQTLTVGDLPVLYRGLYAFSMSKGLKRTHCEKPDREQCALINLVDDPQPIFTCDLAADGCNPKPGPLPTPCKPHGR